MIAKKRTERMSGNGHDQHRVIELVLVCLLGDLYTVLLRQAA